MSIRGPQITLVSVSDHFDPQYGYEFRQLWRGSPAGARGLAESFRQLGIRHEVEIEAGVGTVVAYTQTASDGTAEIPTVQWELNTDYAQLDMRECPKLLEAAGGSASTLARWIADIDAAIEAGQSLEEYYEDQEESPTVSAEQERIYNLRARGVEAWEMARPVLNRIRTYSLSYVSRYPVGGTQLIYTTAALLANASFGVPRAIGELLPSNGGTAPSGTTWGWRLRQTDQRFTPAMNKVEEVIGWTFAAWSTDMYTLAV